MCCCMYVCHDDICMVCGGRNRLKDPPNVVRPQHFAWELEYSCFFFFPCSCEMSRVVLSSWRLALTIRKDVARPEGFICRKNLDNLGKYSVGSKQVSTMRQRSVQTLACSAQIDQKSKHSDCNSPLKVDIGGSWVDVVGAPGVADIDIRRAIDSTPFKQWVSNLKSERGILKPAKDGGASCSLKSVTIQSVDMFGNRVGFVKFKANVIDDATGKSGVCNGRFYTKTNKRYHVHNMEHVIPSLHQLLVLPGIVFARGGAVAILMLLESEKETFVVLTEQARVPVGRVLLELPAGMLDDDAGDFVGTAAREVEEETGIHIKTSDLINLTNFLDESTGRKILPSPGGCDEGITLMLYRSHVKREIIDSLQGQNTGLQDHGEFIKVHVVPYNTLWKTTADVKALSAITIYEMVKREGLLPISPNAP